MSLPLTGNAFRRPSLSRRLSMRPSPRATRILLLLSLVVLANFVDLLLTLDQRSSEMFLEVNPFASNILHSPGMLIGYKLLLVGAACAILLRYRHTFVAEAGCWCACAAHALLLGRWYVYFQIV
jgi:hypothetical protein